MRSSLSISLLFVCCTAALGCGGDETDPLDDPSMFSGLYRSSIEDNCNRLSACNEQNGKPSGPSWVSGCIDDTVNVVNDDSLQQRKFVARFTRCETMTTACAYASCFAGPNGYGDSQVEKVLAYCNADSLCKQARGESASELTTNVCVGFHIGTLDGYSPDQRAGYEAAYPACAALMGCEFTTCFPY